MCEFLKLSPSTNVTKHAKSISWVRYRPSLIQCMWKGSVWSFTLLTQLESSQYMYPLIKNHTSLLKQTPADALYYHISKEIIYIQQYLYYITGQVIQLDWTPVHTHEKPISGKTKRATTIPRPPLERSWRKEFKSTLTTFVKFIFGLFF